MSLQRKSKLISRPPKNFQGICLALAPALVAALAIAACTGRSGSKMDAAATPVAADGKDREPASADAKPVDESLASFVNATGTGKTKHAKGHVKTHTAAKSHAPTENVYVVQIGAFRVKANAEKLNEKLKSEGYPVVLQSLDHSSNGQLFLVRLNPIENRREAETMRMNLKAKVDIDSMILALPKSDREVSSTGAPIEAKMTNAETPATKERSEVH